MRLVRAGVAALALAAAGCGGGDEPRPEAGTPGTTSSPQGLYALEPTRRCLEAEDAVIARLRATQGRLRALRDLAQKTSYEVRFGDARVGLVLSRRPADARLLLTLLRTPDDPYRLEQRRNAVLMYLAADRARGATVRACLTSGRG